MTYVWTNKIENLLDKIRINCINKSEYHNLKYQIYKGKLVYFRIPLIVLSGINSVTAVGLQPYVRQSDISILNCGISLVCGIITSIELFLNLQKKMEMEMSSARDYYKISIEIYKVLSLERDNRMIDGKSFLDEKFSDYLKLLQTSNVIDDELMDDELAPNENFNRNSIAGGGIAAVNRKSIIDYIPASFSPKKRSNSINSVSSTVFKAFNFCRKKVSSRNIDTASNNNNSYYNFFTNASSKYSSPKKMKTHTILEEQPHDEEEEEKRNNNNTAAVADEWESYRCAKEYPTDYPSPASLDIESNNNSTKENNIR